jgi:hypothetical protein
MVKSLGIEKDILSKLKITTKTTNTCVIGFPESRNGTNRAIYLMILSEICIVGDLE